MKIFIAGIGGVFMAGVAQLAKAAGHEVHGCDLRVYPPMSEVLRDAQIEVKQGWSASHLDDSYDRILIGNALSRGNPLVEAALANRLPFQSAPEWLREQLLTARRVIAIAGTHGKTSASAMLAWILHACGKRPGWLIGGRHGNFAQSAHLGEGEWFVIEADEYDTAFFDKRAKFVHYRPHIAVLGNLEFDHADIYADIDALIKQFHHLVRIVPNNGRIIVNADDANLREVLQLGCWSERTAFSLAANASTEAAPADSEWRARALSEDAARFEVLHNGRACGTVDWQCIGKHNMQNALAAIAAAACCEVSVRDACDALGAYRAVARRLQLLHRDDSLWLYDDFAHHPTAIAETLEALRRKHPHSRLLVALELRSNTMKAGAHGARIDAALGRADDAIVVGAQPTAEAQANNIQRANNAATARDAILAHAQLHKNQNIVIITMSNGDFDGLPGQLRDALASRQ